MTSLETLPLVSRGLALPAFSQPLTLSSTPISPPSSGSVIVRVLTSVIRPHHRLGFEGKSPLSFPVPYRPGHTAIARVLATGPDSVKLSPGQLIYVDGFLAARDDPTGVQAIIGLHDGATPKPKKLFNAWEGMWRDIATVALELCYALNEESLMKMGYSFSDMQMIERLAVAYGAVDAAKLKAGQTVIVAPATGNYSGAVAEVAAQLGCNVIAVTRSATKLQSLSALHPRITTLEIPGAEADISTAILAACSNTGADAYIDASPPLPGSAVSHFKPCVSAVRNGGCIVLSGMIFDVNLEYINIMLKNITIKGQWMYSRQQVQDVIKMVESGILKLGKEAGHEIAGEYRLEEWEEAIGVAEGVAGWGKQILFTPSSDTP